MIISFGFDLPRSLFTFERYGVNELLMNRKNNIIEWTLSLCSCNFTVYYIYRIYTIYGKTIFPLLVSSLFTENVHIQNLIYSLDEALRE